MRNFLLLATLLVPATASATEPITFADTTFFVEEAFRADAPVFQQAIGLGDRAWSYTITQEWAGDSSHVLGYSIPLILGEGRGEMGLGVASVDYRYQAGGREGESLGFNPRISLVIPLASDGGGSPGVAVSAPFTILHGSRLASHWNLGGSWSPESGSRTNRQVLAGAAIARVLNDRTAGVIEATVTYSQEMFEGVSAPVSRTVVVSLGIRRAIDVVGYRFVPGIAMPLTIEDGKGSLGISFHLMFETALSSD